MLSCNLCSLLVLVLLLLTLVLFTLVLGLGLDIIIGHIICIFSIPVVAFTLLILIYMIYIFVNCVSSFYERTWNFPAICRYVNVDVPMTFQNQPELP